MSQPYISLCSCGTAAIALSLVAAGVPWAPVVAFLVSSPLMSPSTYALTAGVMGFQMADAKAASSIGLGLAHWYPGPVRTSAPWRRWR